MEINISAKMRERIVDQIAIADEEGNEGGKRSLNLDVFREARDETLRIIGRDVFQRFSASPQGRMAFIEMEAKRFGGTLMEGWILKRGGFKSQLKKR
eukprot:5521012-Prorocentrum_lima.AAC.1